MISKEMLDLLVKGFMEEVNRGWANHVREQLRLRGVNITEISPLAGEARLCDKSGVKNRRENDVAHPYHHAVSSARKFGGKPEDYQAIHNWFDASKEHCADFRHRMLRHHSEGIFEAERVFGVTIANSDGRQVPTRLIGEQHVKEDFAGRIPALADWIRAIRPEPWMGRTERLDVEQNEEKVA